MFIGVWRTVNAGSETTRVATAIPRVYMNTNIACFITACVAGEIFFWIFPLELCRELSTVHLQSTVSIHNTLSQFGTNFTSQIKWTYFSSKLISSCYSFNNISPRGLSATDLRWWPLGVGSRWERKKLMSAKNEKYINVNLWRIWEMDLNPSTSK